MKGLVGVLLMLAPLWVVAAPQALVRTQLVGADNAVVGGVVMLQVDLLVDTWFDAPPELPALEVAGAVVSPPSGEAVHLTEEQGGVKFFGLRFNYQITPQVAQPYNLAPLTITVHPGQGAGPVQLMTSAQHFSAGQPAGVPPGEPVLVASSVTLSQAVEPSSPTLAVGDTVTRSLETSASGAQAMLIPAPQFAAVSGLERFVQPATVHSLGDGRGGSGGGAREDAVRYRATRAGSYVLPAISLRWWSSVDRQVHTATVPAITLQVAAGNGAAPPFSIVDDLRELRRSSQLHIGGHWLALGAAAALLLLLIYFGRAWPRRISLRWQRWRAERQRAWLASTACAWRQARRQLAGSPARLDALYLWARRRWGVLELRRLAGMGGRGAALQGALGQLYGPARNSEQGLRALAKALSQLHSSALAQRPATARLHSLKPLNPGLSEEAIGE
jgi:hypothetical protein